MAAQKQSIFEEQDRHVIRLRKMCDAGSTKAFYKLLRWLNARWMPPTPFKEYLKTEKKVSMKEFKKALKPSQKAIMEKDLKGTTYDVSLLYLLILWGNDCLADKDDEVWKKKSESLEFLITCVKNLRNDVMHCYDPIDAKEFHGKTEQLRKDLKAMITKAGSICKHIQQTEVNQTLKVLDTLINKTRDDPLDPKDFATYKKELLFKEHCDFVQDKGKKALHGRHRTYETLTPVSHLAQTNFPLHEVYTSMELEGDSEKKDKVELENLLEDSSNEFVTDEIILVEGDVGVGKTTLTKKMLSDWTNETGEIKHLDSYDLVLHAECRDQIKTYKELLASSMADVSKSFQGEDLTMVTLDLRCLIIIDGLDELNKNSTQLFKEILNLKKHHDITVIVTTRPEAVKRYYAAANSHQLKTKHIRLIGIPKEKREEFVKKYYEGIENKGLDSSKQGIGGLLKYLQRTEDRLSYLWRLPYNLALLIILWTHYHAAVTNITTAPELYWEMHGLYISKLIERLQNNKDTQHLLLSSLEWKIQYFISCMCRESLVGLKNDDIMLTEEAYKRLENTCQKIEIPVEEMVGAFLKRTETSSGIRYSFSHKGEQDYLAGQYFWMRITSPALSPAIQKITKSVQDVLTENAVSVDISKNIIKLTERELKNESFQGTTKKDQTFNVEYVEKEIETFLTLNNVPEDLNHDICRLIKEKLSRSLQETNLIHDTLKEIHDYSTFEITKFQNVLVSLIGMFYLKTAQIADATKMEALNLLQQTGVRSRDAWINILNSVKCDEYVASFISKQNNILKGTIKINDSSLFAYTSLFQALKTPVQGAQNVSLSIAIKGNISDAGDFLNLISNHKFKVTRILVTEANFMQYISMLRTLSSPLRDPRSVNVEIRINDETSDISELLFEIAKQQFNVDRIYLLREFRNPSPHLPSEDVLNQVFARCQVKRYCGRVTPGLKLPRNLETLEASIGDSNSFETLLSFLQTNSQQLNDLRDHSPIRHRSIFRILSEMWNPPLWNHFPIILHSAPGTRSKIGTARLRVCVKPEAASFSLQPLPHTGSDDFLPDLIVPDIRSPTDVQNAIKIAEKLLPTTGMKMFNCLAFPRMFPSVDLVKKLLLGLQKSVHVKHHIVFPSACTPSSKERQEILRVALMTSLQGIIVWGGEYCDIDEW